jgi:hypothetical protein
MLLNSGALSDEEDQAFRSMLSFIDADKRTNPRVLSSRQRSWAESVYKKLGLDKDEPSENLFSTGAVKKLAGPLPTMGWEKFPRPLKPPGR